MCFYLRLTAIHLTQASTLQVIKGKYLCQWLYFDTWLAVCETEENTEIGGLPIDKQHKWAVLNYEVFRLSA